MNFAFVIPVKTGIQQCTYNERILHLFPDDLVKTPKLIICHLDRRERS